MTVANILRAVEASGGASSHWEDPRRMTVETDTPPALMPQLLSRFLALIEDVTDELMRGRDRLDRQSCRADAIELLIATSGQQGNPQEDGGESPLTYMLLEEQQKAAVFLKGSGGTDTPAPLFESQLRTVP